MDYKKIIADCIQLDSVTFDEIYTSITVPADPSLGDFCLPCFKFAKALRKSPQVIANDIKEMLIVGADGNPPDNVGRDCLPVAPQCAFVTIFSSVETVAGYVNFRMSRKLFVQGVVSVRGTDPLTTPVVNGSVPLTTKYPPNGKTVCIDYSSVNIAKPFHIGHLLTTAIGGSLYRIYKYLGYNVVGINHLGDWGTQFGKLISAYKRWGSEADIEKRGITALSELYVKFHSEAEKDKTLEDEARAYFKSIEQGEREALSIFERFKAVTMREVEKVYRRLGIKFDSYNGESFYNDKMDGAVELLKQKGLLTDSDGAKVVNLEKFGMPPCLILKSDGASLYATRDLAAALYRKKTYDFHKNLYVVAYQQNLHFNQVFKVLELLDLPWAGDCVHVPFGMVSLEGVGALSTRKGNVVYLNDVLETAVQKTKDIIAAKNPELVDKEKTAEAVGVGAVVFMALSTGRIKDLVFSYDKALNFDGETGPYLQYTHARCCSVLCKSEGLGVRSEEWRRESNQRPVVNSQEFDGNNSVVPHPSLLTPPPDDLTDDEGFELVKLISRFDEIVENAAEKYEPSILARYLIDVAQSFNRYYISHRIIGEPNREKLTLYVRNVLKTGLDLLLIDAPEKM
ncbi:MAG: arginine--tRNA ligase [Firmicutes bacterium]|nr:arginine--tRNA ligase [Bacillota bacterium]